MHMSYHHNPFYRHVTVSTEIALHVADTTNNIFRDLFLPAYKYIINQNVDLPKKTIHEKYFANHEEATGVA
jgi:hypothetical protein